MRTEAPDHYLMPFPSMDVWTAIGSGISPLFAAIGLSREVSRSVVTQRDVLLPRLVSEEVRIKDSGEAILR